MVASEGKKGSSLPPLRNAAADHRTHDAQENQPAELSRVPTKIDKGAEMRNPLPPGV